MSQQDDVFDIAEYARSGREIPSHAHRFRIRIDETSFDVTDPHPSGRDLLGLASKSPEDHFLTQIIVGADDQVVEPDERVDLRRRGVERFTVVAKPHRDRPHELFIFVNRLKKTRADGVKDKMTGAEIAALAGISRDVAVVRRDNSERAEIGMDEPITICPGDGFLVTRDKVNGGHE